MIIAWSLPQASADGMAGHERNAGLGGHPVSVTGSAISGMPTHYV